MRIIYGSVNAWSQVQILRLKTSADAKCLMFLRGITIDFRSLRTDVREMHISRTKVCTNHVVLCTAQSERLTANELLKGERLIASRVYPTRSNSDDQQQQRRTKWHQTKDETTSWHQDESPKTAKTQPVQQHLQSTKIRRLTGRLHINMCPSTLTYCL